MTVASSSRFEVAPLLQCPACCAEWKSRQRISISLAELSDSMLTAPLAERIGELAYSRCAECESLIAVDGRRDSQLLNEIYAGLPEDYWGNLNSHQGLGQAIERRLRQSGVTDGRLWDVGCGNGGLLASFGSQWEKSGIEPGLTAVEQANARNLNVLAGTASELRLKEVADVVLLVDVDEHLTDPQKEFEAIYDMLQPGGVLVALTGRADAPTARFAGPLWYYLRCFGHVTVFSRQALRGSLARAGFVDISTERFEHPSAVRISRWVSRLAGNVIRRCLAKRVAPLHLYRDHQLVIGHKPRSIAPSP